jgi:hypothetical protein
MRAWKGEGREISSRLSSREGAGDEKRRTRCEHEGWLRDHVRHDRENRVRKEKGKGAQTMIPLS